MRKALISGLILVLFLAVCVSSVSAAVTVTASYATNNPTFGGDSQQASNPNADDEDDYNIYASGSIPLSNDGTSNVTIDGVSFVPETGFTIADLNITIVSGATVPANSTASVSLQARIPEKLNAVTSEFKESAFKVATATLKSGTASVASFDVYMQRENNLRLKRAYVIVNDDNSRVTDGDKVDDVKPGSAVEVKIEAESTYKDDDDVVIEDVELFVVIDDRDLDVDEDSDIGDVDPDSVETTSVKFDVEADCDDGSYDMVISLEGKDEFGSRMGERIKIDFKVKKNRHDIVIDQVSLLPAQIDCGKISTVSVKITNIGKEDEEEAVLEVYNDALSYYSRLMGINLDEGDSVVKTFSVPVPPSTSTGDYSVTVKAYWEMGEMTDVTSETLSVKCTPQQAPQQTQQQDDDEEEEEEEDEPQATATTAATTTAATVPVTTTVQDDSGSPIFGSAGYLIALIAAIIVVVAAIAVLIVKFVVL